jgi:phosphomannomutase
MALDPKLFKAYDIRGLSPEEIDADFAYRVGQAMVMFTKAKTVVVGRDMRDTTPTLFEALARGVNSQGADVIDIGLVTTPMLYYAVAEYDLHDAGIMITASHNPKQYNGFKLCYGDALPIGGESGMKDVRDIALAGPYPEKKQGTVVETDIRASYFKKLFTRVDVSKFRELDVVVDTANGMEGAVIKEIFSHLPSCRMTGLFLELDGAFPNHEANPLKDETLDALKEAVRSTRADVGVAFDGDGDRVGLVDELGHTVRADIIAALVAPRLLAKDPGATVLYDVRESMVAREVVEAAGGRAIMCRVGHGLIKPHMRRENAVFASELSGHFYFRDVYGAESSDLVMLMALELLSEAGQSLSALVAPLMRYHHSGEINSTVADKDRVFALLEETYAHEAAGVSKIDGLRLDFHRDDAPDEDWWFSVRASNTEPLLRLNLEAKKKDKMEARREELLKIIRA